MPDIDTRIINFLTDLDTMTVAQKTAIKAALEVSEGGGAELTSYVDQVESLPDYPATFPADHAAATVTGNGISITGQQISLSIGTGSTHVAAGNHNHDGVYQPAGSYAPASGISPSAITGTAVVTADSRLSDARTPTAHTHPQSDVTNLVTDLAAKARAIETKTTNFTAVLGGRYIVEGTVTVTDPTGTAAGDSYEVWIGSGTCTLGGVTYQPSRFSIRRRYTGSAWATPAPVLSDTLSAVGLTTSGVVNFNTGTTFSYATGLDTGHRTALGLGALATVTPGTGVATALAAATNGTGGVVTFGGNIGAATGTSLTLGNGTVGAPSINFGDATTGLYRQSADRIGVTIAGALNAVFYSSGMYTNTGKSFGIGGTSLWFRDGGAGVQLTTTAGGGTFAPFSCSNLTASGTVTATGNVILPTSTTPASASATGVAGTICRDSDYIYVCVATNTWKRVAISTW